MVASETARSPWAKWRVSPPTSRAECRCAAEASLLLRPQARGRRRNPQYAIAGATRSGRARGHRPEIWRMNQEQIRNPHNISPGDVLVLDRSVSPPQLRIADSGAGPGLGGAEGVKLLPRIYTQPLTSEAIPAISPRAIEPFLTQPLIIEEGGLDRAPRIIATEENRVNLGAGNVAYVSGFGGSDAPAWQIYRAGRPLVDPDNQRTLGFEAVNPPQYKSWIPRRRFLQEIDSFPRPR